MEVNLENAAARRVRIEGEIAREKELVPGYTMAHTDWKKDTWISWLRQEHGDNSYKSAVQSPPPPYIPSPRHQEQRKQQANNSCKD